jgi:hypothetical protein
MRDFIVIQEHDHNDYVAMYNSIFCKQLDINYYPHSYYQSILLLEDFKHQFKYIVQIDRNMVLREFHKGALQDLSKSIYLNTNITLINTSPNFHFKDRNKLPKDLIVLGSLSSEEIIEHIRTNKLGYQDCKIVVARYNESIDWLGTFDSGMLQVYNKGTPIDRNDLTSDIESIELPNVGREAHTYLHYIVTHYDALPNYVVFTQASINPNEGCITNSYAFVTGLIESCFMNMGISRNYLRYDTLYPTTYEMRERSSCDPCADDLSFGKWFEEFVEQPFEENPKWFKGAIMCVGRNMIHSRSKAYYQKLLRAVSLTKTPEEAYYLERCWYYIFQPRRVFCLLILDQNHSSVIDLVEDYSSSVDIFVIYDRRNEFSSIHSSVMDHAFKIFKIESRESSVQDGSSYDMMRSEMEKHFEPNNRDLILLLGADCASKKDQLERIALSKSEFDEVRLIESKSILFPYKTLKMHALSEIVDYVT